MLTPLQSYSILIRENKMSFSENGIVYTMDGPFGTPFEKMAPVAEFNDRQFTVNGEIGDVIDEDSFWIEV